MEDECPPLGNLAKIWNDASGKSSCRHLLFRVDFRDSMAEQPALNRSYVISYAANDRDFPVIGLRLDPRVAGYRVPEDLSPHPDSKRYPNHVFTGSNPTNGDERVTHVYEILPAPWVPFTRYDDDLGPIQGRRRAVKNEGQQADLAADKKVSYEGREGSAIVSNEIEETWSIKVDEDGNSLFPIKDRDFYDPSRGAVQERRQLFVPTGEEVGTLENIDGVITQTSYEPYNEFLSVKIIQTYKVDGPQLIGSITNNEGQLATVTTQRKGALNYSTPSPTATKTVEVAREDAESLIERITETPEVFSAKSYRKIKADLTPQKFRASQQDIVFEQTLEGEVEEPSLGITEFEKSEQQVTKFVKRVATTSRNTIENAILVESVLTPEQQLGIRTLTLSSGAQSFTPSATLVDASVEALGDGRTVLSETVVGEVFPEDVKTLRQGTQLPQKFIQNQTTESKVIASKSAEPENIDSGGTGVVESTAQRITAEKVRKSKTIVEQRSGVSGQIYTQELGGGIANTTEFLGVSNILPSFGTIAAETESIGGTSIQRVTKLNQVPNLKGQEYDDITGVVVPYEQIFVDGQQIDSFIGQPNCEITPRDVYHAQKRTILSEKVKEEYLKKFYALEDVVSVSLPDQLIDIIVEVVKSEGGDNATSTGNSSSATASATASFDYSVGYSVRNGYSGLLDATKYIFFLDSKNKIDVVDFLNTKLQENIQKWPVFNTESSSFSIITQSETVTATASVSLPNNRNKSVSIDKRSDVQTFQIPQSLHKEITINAGILDESGTGFITNFEVERTATASGAQAGTSTASAKAKANIKVNAIRTYITNIGGQDVIYTQIGNTIGATNPESIEVGKYLYSVNSQLYRFGLVKIEAVVVEITPAAVY
jgi:hypothetical protein